MRSRRPTRQLKVGPVAVGGDAPVSIQSMASTYTYDIAFPKPPSYHGL